MSKDSMGTKRPLSLLWNTATNTNSLWTLLLYVEAIQMVTARFYSGGKLETRPGFIPWIQIHRYIYEIQNTNTQIHPWNTEYKYTDTLMKHRIQIHRYIWNAKKTKTQTINSYTNKYDIVREIQTLSQNTQIDGWTDSKEGWVILYVISDTFLKRMYLYLYLYLHMIPFCSACIWRPSWGLKAGPLIQSSSEKQFKIRITRK